MSEIKFAGVISKFGPIEEKSLKLTIDVFPIDKLSLDELKTFMGDSVSFRLSNSQSSLSEYSTGEG